MRLRLGRGSHLTLHATAGRVPMRLLGECDVEFDSGWSLPVLAALPDLVEVTGAVHITTAVGVLTVAARLAHEGSGLMLRPVEAAAARTEQRRGAVRGPLTLPLRGAVLEAPSRPDLADLVFDGVTVDVSESGISFTGTEPVGPAGLLSADAVVFVELTLPSGRPVPAVVRLIGDGRPLRGHFADIARADAEQLVRLVFAEQRRRLAAQGRPG